MRLLLDTAGSAIGSPPRNVIWVSGFVATVAAGATIAYMAAGWSLGDAAYMVLLTIYTVGYTEVRPIDTAYLRFVTMTTMVLGCTGMILLTGALVQLFTLLQLRDVFGANAMQHRIDRLDRHIVICGYGRIGSMLAKDLAAADTPFVVVERSANRLAEAEAAGHACLVGDATEEAVLVAAGIGRARALATVLPDDAANVFISLTARALNAGIEIIARGEVPTTERKLLHAGADHVILPTHIGAERIARMLLFPKGDYAAGSERARRIERELEALGLELEDLELPPGAAAAGMTIADAERHASGAFLIVQLTRGETVIPRPVREEVIEAGDRLLLVMRDPAAAARALAELGGGQRPRRRRG